MSGRTRENVTRHRQQVIEKRIFEDKSETEIAAELKITQGAVSKMLTNRNVKVILEQDNIKDLAEALKYKYKLKGAFVVYPGYEEYIYKLLGYFGARYFMKHLVQHGRYVGIGCGRTMLEFARSIPSHVTAFPSREFTQLVVEMHPDDIDTAPSTLVDILRSKFVSSKASAIQLLPFVDPEIKKKIERDDFFVEIKSKAQQRLNIAVLGIGTIDLDIENVFTRMLRDVIFERDERALRKAFEGIEIAGEIINVPIDSRGRRVKIKELDDKIIRILDLADLQRMVKEGKKDVLLVAGGQYKRNVIGLAVKHGFCNHLVTDADVAKSLLTDEDMTIPAKSILHKSRIKKLTR